MTPAGLPPLDRLIVCPHCDVIHVLEDMEPGDRARCRRCGSTLIWNRPGAELLVAVLSLTSLILICGGVFFPFLSVSTYGLSHESSVFGAALAFHGRLAPLSFAVFLMIVLLPAMRYAALVYSLLPIGLGRRPAAMAGPAFRLAEWLRPWSMAEVFVIGTGVALVKVSGMASVSLGPAFWAFSAMIFSVAGADSFINRWSIWAEIEANRRS